MKPFKGMMARFWLHSDLCLPVGAPAALPFPQGKYKGSDCLADL